jgi:hypothetical protein
MRLRPTFAQPWIVAPERNAAGAPVVADGDGCNSGTSGDGNDFSVTSEAPDCDILLQHKAAALLNLHAQAMAVQNISAVMLLVLDVTSTFYTRWCELFPLVLGKY